MSRVGAGWWTGGWQLLVYAGQNKGKGHVQQQAGCAQGTPRLVHPRHGYKCCLLPEVAESYLGGVFRLRLGFQVRFISRACAFPFCSFAPVLLVCHLVSCFFFFYWDFLPFSYRPPVQPPSSFKVPVIFLGGIRTES